MNKSRTPDSLSGHDAVRNALDGPPGSIHMTGIGGVGMSGLALLLKARGWTVTGCDSADGPLLPWLREKDIACTVGHNAEHLSGRPDFIVRSPAVRHDEDELVQAKEAGIPIIDRGKLLPALMSPYRLIAVSGTHGKTTTASMIAWILKYAGEQISYCIGGVCPCLGAVAHAESDGYMVIEADESDGTLQYYDPEIALVTSMDIDHVDHYVTKEMHRDVYKQFSDVADRVVYCGNDADSVDLFSRRENSVSFGIDCGADYSAHSIEMNERASSFKVRAKDQEEYPVTLATNGRHNVANALSAAAVASAVGIGTELIRQALGKFRLPLRRYEQVARGKGITVISDYAHHPVEINALLEQAFLSGAKRVVTVFQPHRYSRTKMFMKEFVDVLERVDVLVLLPVYAASEAFIAGGTTDELYKVFQARGHQAVTVAESVKDGWSHIQKLWKDGDLILLVGAGDIDQIGKWAAEALNG